MEPEEEKKKRKCFFESLRTNFKAHKLTAEEQEIAKNHAEEMYTCIKNQIHRIIVKEDQLFLIDALKAGYLSKRAEIEQINFQGTSIMINPTLLSPNQVHQRFQPKPGFQTISFLKSQLSQHLKGRLDKIKDKN